METARLRALGAIYRRTRYVVPGGEVRIGRRSPQADQILRRHRKAAAVLMTAWNPLSHRKPAGWNQRMQQRLCQVLRGYPNLPASGGARGWSEDHLLVLMPPARAAVVARRFRQNAIVVLRAGQPARLAWTGPLGAGIER